jgi:hypothetical protein
MTHPARAELAKTVRRRYSSAAGKEKSRIFEEFVATTGYHEKSAIRVLNSESAPKLPQTRHRPPLYDEAARGALFFCGRLPIGSAVNACALCCPSCCPLWNAMDT